MKRVTVHMPSIHGRAVSNYLQSSGMLLIRALPYGNSKSIQQELYAKDVMVGQWVIVNESLFRSLEIR